MPHSSFCFQSTLLASRCVAPRSQGVLIGGVSAVVRTRLTFRQVPVPKNAPFNYPSGGHSMNLGNRVGVSIEESYQRGPLRPLYALNYRIGAVFDIRNHNDDTALSQCRAVAALRCPIFLVWRTTISISCGMLFAFSSRGPRTTAGWHQRSVCSEPVRSPQSWALTWSSDFAIWARLLHLVCTRSAFVRRGQRKY